VAAFVTGIALHLRGEVRDLWFEWLQAHRPDLLARYQELYRRGAYMPVPERERLSGLVKGPDQPPDKRMRGRVVRRGAGNQPEGRDVQPTSVKQNEQQRLF
jgi:hypothetical protein